MDRNNVSQASQHVQTSIKNWDALHANNDDVPHVSQKFQQQIVQKDVQESKLKQPWSDIPNKARNNKSKVNHSNASTVISFV